MRRVAAVFDFETWGPVILICSLMLGALISIGIAVTAISADAARDEAKQTRQFKRVCKSLNGHPMTLDLGETNLCIRNGRVILRDD